MGGYRYGKRSADAEAEADPALVYNAVTPVHSVVSSPLVSALTPAATVKTVHTPVVSTLSHPLPTQSQLSPPSPLSKLSLLSPLSRLSLLSPLSTLMLVSTLSTPQSSTLLDPQSTTERERPRLIP